MDVAATGIPGLDIILHGGFPTNRIYLIEGSPGTGKTTLALQFLMTGRDAGEPTLYITFSESTDELRQMAKSHHWSLDGITFFELNAVDPELRVETVNTLFHPSEVELNEVTESLLAQIRRINPRRIAFDSLSEMRLLAQSPLRYRRQLLALKQFFRSQDCTVLLLDDAYQFSGDRQIQTLVHGIVSLENMAPEYGQERRRLRVTKLRAVPLLGGLHDYKIRTGGLEVFPRIVAGERFSPNELKSASSGVPELDKMLGSGLDRGSSTLLIGAAGTGKSGLATLYASAAAKRGERAAAFLFDEIIPTYLARAESLGMSLQPYLDSKRLSLRQIDPAELSPGEFGDLIRHAVEKEGVRLIIVDSLNGYLQAMASDRALTSQFHELLTYLGQNSVSTIMVVAQTGLIGSAMASPVDVSYLADNVILLRYFEAGGAIRKAISVVKKRSGYHETTIREYNLSMDGIKLGDPLTEFRGVLTGVPVYLGGDSPLLNADESKKPIL